MISKYYEDIPAAKPQFDYDLVAKALSSLLLQPHDGAVVLGIHGPWGAGKTTLLGALHSELKQRYPEDKAIFVEFNAWKFQDRQALWRALILRLLGELRVYGGDPARIEELEQALYRAFAVEEMGPWRVDWRALVTELIGIVLSIVKLDFVAEAVKGTVGGSLGWIGRLFGSSGSEEGQQSTPIDKQRVDRLARVLERTTVERQVLQVQSIEQFLDEFRKLMAEFRANGQRVFVFIDDLDRCLPESALEVFESIKLFLDAPGCGYMVALDREVIRKGLAVKYAPPSEAPVGPPLVDPDEYIEKTISVSFDLPQLAHDDVYELITAAELPLVLDDHQKQLLVTGLGNNPRRVKRFMNTLALHVHLATVATEANLPVLEWLSTNSQPRKFDVFLKLLLISYRYSGVIGVAVEDLGLLERLQTISNAYHTTVKQNPARESEARQARQESLAGEFPVVANLHSEEDFWRLMAETPRFTDHRELLLALSNWFRYRPTAPP
jgi:hypothetical protein